MFEKEIKFICDFCFNKISKAGSFLTFEKLKGIEIHPAILNYLSAEINYQVYKDRQILLRKSSFDYSGAEISKHFKMIVLEIKKSRRINETEINNLIKKAVMFNFDFLTKPNETFLNFIFQDTENKGAEEVIALLDYPYYYKYLSQILISYFEKKQLLTVDKKDFEFLLNKIDSELLLAQTNELVDNALDAVAGFFNIGAVLHTQIPIQAIELYLNEKKLNDHLLRLQNGVKQSPKAKYEIDEIKKIIYNEPKVTEQKTEQVQSEVKTANENEQKNIETNVSENLNSELNTVAKEDILPKTTLLNESEKLELEDLEITTPNSKETINLSDEMKLEEDIETFSIEPDELEGSIIENTREAKNIKKTSSADVLTFLSDREIQRIISSVFNEDKDDFATTIETISECKTYEKATEILKSLYTTYNVNPYSKDAILLTNAVAKYFTTA